jgi:hypothetical protein
LEFVSEIEKQIWAIFLDIKGAFPAEDIHTTARNGIPSQYVNWIGEKLKGRSVAIIFDGFHSEPLNTLAGLDQGCSLL